MPGGAYLVAADFDMLNAQYSKSTSHTCTAPACCGVFNDGAAVYHFRYIKQQAVHRKVVVQIYAGAACSVYAATGFASSTAIHSCLSSG